MKNNKESRFYKLAVDLEEVTWGLDTKWEPQEPEEAHEEQAWLLDDACRDELNRIAKQWVWDRFLPALSEKHKYYLRLRFTAGYRFLYQFTLTDGTSVFEFPKMSEEEFLEWILIDWWHSVGAQEALHHIEFAFRARTEK